MSNRFRELKACVRKYGEEQYGKGYFRGEKNAKEYFHPKSFITGVIVSLIGVATWIMCS